MNIGEAAELSGLPSKTIRYYEEIGLLKPDRSENGYRFYCLTDVERLQFLQRARNLGFSLDECRQLLALYKDQGRASHDVKEVAIAKLGEIDQKIEALMLLRTTLRDLVGKCKGDFHPECPIIEQLAGKDDF